MKDRGIIALKNCFLCIYFKDHNTSNPVKGSKVCSAADGYSISIIGDYDTLFMCLHSTANLLYSLGDEHVSKLSHSYST